MNREHHRWHSPSLGRDMELLVFGHGGARVLAFPTSQGRFYEWEDRGMTRALGEHLRNGWVQLFCVDSVDAESWYADWKHPVDRARRQEDYERYLLDEVLPLTRRHNPDPFLITTGASFGAYHAAAFAFRHPHEVSRVIGMSGLYDITRFAGGHYDADIYRHNPSHFVSHLDDHEHLEAMRRMDIILATGRDDAFRQNNEHLSRILWEKGVGNALRLWDGWAHDWPWWHQMIQRYIGGHD
ncbi:MAG: alpha/beta hydrolase-fold protein [Rubricoccaceae bacterium]|nr:alpha/beta hydrolase-fold protein [Rubricoccaceae bacterium]